MQGTHERLRVAVVGAGAGVADRPWLHALQRLPFVSMAGAGGAGAIVVAGSDVRGGELALAALETGRHVYLDDPLALSLDDACRLTTAAEDSEAVVAVALTHRLDPLYQRAQALLREGVVGRLREVDTSCRRPLPAPGSAVVRRLGGDHIDLLGWLSGEALSDVTHVEPSPDETYVEARLAGGAHAEAVFGTGGPRRCAWVFAGDDGWLAVDGLTGRVSIARNVGARHARSRRDALHTLPLVGREHVSDLAIEAWARRAAGLPAARLPAPADAVQALEAIVAIERAAAVPAAG